MSPQSSSRTTVRRVQEDDIIALVHVLAPEVSRAQLHGRWQEHQDGYRQMLVAEVNGQVVGTISIGGSRYHRPDSLRMFALDVGAAFRRMGIGTALIEAAEEKAQSDGLRTVHLEVATNNADAISLYERLGYQHQGDPIIDRWWRITDDGSREQVEDLSWVMIKRL